MRSRGRPARSNGGSNEQGKVLGVYRGAYTRREDEARVPVKATLPSRSPLAGAEEAEMSDENERDGRRGSKQAAEGKRRLGEPGIIVYDTGNGCMVRKCS